MAEDQIEMPRGDTEQQQTAQLAEDIFLAMVNLGATSRLIIDTISKALGVTYEAARDNVYNLLKKGIITLGSDLNPVLTDGGRILYDERIAQSGSVLTIAETATTSDARIRAVGGTLLQSARQTTPPNL